MKKKTGVLGVAVLLAALLALSGVAQSAMWVGGQIGGNFPASTDLSNNATINDVGIRPSVIGGVTIGYDFINSGFGGYNWPDWMKYFSFAMDLTYNRLCINNQSVTVNGVPMNLLPEGNRADGYCVTWTFLFMAHYGFLPDAEVPSGRIHPYIGVGPAIMFSGLDLGSVNMGSCSSTNIALVVEPGIRFMCLKNVSIDTAFRWRYAVPDYDFANNNSIKIDPLNQFSFLVRANYHF